jgi:hypothetical protein
MNEIENDYLVLSIHTKMSLNNANFVSNNISKIFIKLCA